MILVAEDSEINQSLMSAMLNRLGHRHHVVSNGAEAVEFVSTHHCALVLMDLQMPVMDGRDAARAIRNLPGGAGRVPIICMSGSLAGIHTAGLKEAGMTATLDKPFRLTELAEMIETYVGVTEQGA